MDAKAKIEEMLRRKREGSGAKESRAKSEPSPALPPQPPQPPPAQSEQQHSSVLDRINAMLKQKQTPAPSAAPVVTPPPAPADEPQKLPFGLCLCCKPPNALVATPDHRIRCPGSGSEYVRNIDGTVVPRPPEVNLQSADSIEAALNDGNATFYYGGFIGGQNREQTPRRRRRR